MGEVVVMQDTGENGEKTANEPKRSVVWEGGESKLLAGSVLEL